MASKILDVRGCAASCDPVELEQILGRNRLITPEEFREAQAHAHKTGESLVEALTRRGQLSVEDILQALALNYELPYLFRGELPIPAPIVGNLSAKYLRQYLICPVSVETGVLTVASADPLNPLVVDDLRQATGCQIRLAVSPPAAIIEAIERTYEDGASPLQRIVRGIDDEHGPQDQEDVNQLRDMAAEAPVVRLVNLIIEGAIAAGASDVHIEPFENKLRVRYRIDGVLFDQEPPPRRLQAAPSSRIKIMGEMNIAERRLPQDGRIRVPSAERKVDIRVSTVPTVYGESVVMRILDRSERVPALGQARLHRGDADGDRRRLITRPHGIVLVTGPTGSGKTTTLYAALNKINRPDAQDHHRSRTRSNTSSRA